MAGLRGAVTQVSTHTRQTIPLPEQSTDLVPLLQDGKAFGEYLSADLLSVPVPYANLARLRQPVAGLFAHIQRP